MLKIIIALVSVLGSAPVHCSVLRSCSFVCVMLRGTDVLIYGSVLRGFRPSFGRWAGVVV